MATPSQQRTGDTEAESTPMRRSRIQEKEELAYLNDRFASYIEQVRQMKESNLRLELELTSVREQLGREADSVKALYEAELADARNLIDETAKEKARQQIVASKNATRVDELEAELKALKDDVAKLQADLNAAERNASSLDAQRKSAISDKAKLNKQVKDLQAELDEIRSTVDAMKETLEAETLGKVDLQNNIQSLREELAFRKKVYEEELVALRQKLAISVTGTVETDFAGQLEGRLEAAIDELREKSDSDIAQYKAEVEEVYKDKMANLEAQSARDATTITRLNIEIRKISNSVSQTNTELTRLQRENDRLEAALREKDEEIARLRQQHGEEIARLVEELRDLRTSYEVKIREYEQLMDIKIQLDQEIATYRALLQEEENRLNMTPTPPREKRRGRSQTSEREPKKPRLEPTVTQEQQTRSTATGFLQISDVDPTGKYIQVKNMSDQIESLGGFKIVHVAGDGEEVIFRFHARSKLQGGAAVTVWGTQSEGAKHNPPTDIIWRSLKTWGSGDQTSTKLLNNAGEIVATFNQRKETSPSKASTSFEGFESSGIRSFPHIPEEMERDVASSSRIPLERPQLQQVGDEHVFHQKGDPQGRCRTS